MTRPSRKVDGAYLIIRQSKALIRAAGIFFIKNLEIQKIILIFVLLNLKFNMKVKDLKKFLDQFDDEQEVFAESKISGKEFPFELIMEIYGTSKGPAFGLR